VDPLSSLTYTLRHKRQALLLLVLIGSLTLGVYMMVGTLSTYLETSFYPLHYLTRVSLVSEGGGLGSNGVTIAGRVRAHEDVAHVLPENGLYINVPITGESPPSPCWGNHRNRLTGGDRGLCPAGKCKRRQCGLAHWRCALRGRSALCSSERLYALGHTH